MQQKTLFQGTVALLALVLNAHAEARSVEPHFRSSTPATAAMVSAIQSAAPGLIRLPFENPGSIACIYRLVPDPQPGCPVAGARNLPSGGSGMIVIVNAYHYPAAQNDINVFSRQFGLPECTDANPCLTVLFATGIEPPVNPLWAANAAGTIEYAHAFAPSAQIVLVESATGTAEDLDFAIQFANQYVREHSPTGTAQMLLPWGDFESPDQVNTDALLTEPGIVYIAGNQFGNFVEYPATSPNVIAVGVSGIIRDSDGVFRGEFASNFDAGGVSAFETRPPYQDVIADLIGNHRAVPDVALISDPIRGAVLLYDSVDLDGFVGWQYTGNVGIAEAIWAGIINVADSRRPNTAAELTAFYNHLGNRSVFRDIVIGQAFGKHAGPGWDVLSGLGAGLGYQAK